MCCGPLAAELEEEADTAVGGDTLAKGQTIDNAVELARALAHT